MESPISFKDESETTAILVFTTLAFLVGVAYMLFSTLNAPKPCKDSDDEDDSDDKNVTESEDQGEDQQNQEQEENKEQPETFVPFTYRPKMHFISWLKRITNQTKYVIPKQITDAVLSRLLSKGVLYADDVNWGNVDKSIRWLAKNKDKKFNDYYAHVYQITNEIRGCPVMNFSEDAIQQFCDMFDPIYQSWTKHKDPSRKNFLPNGVVMILMLQIKGYPQHILQPFQLLYTPSKADDMVCKLILQDLGANFEPIAVCDNSLIQKNY